MDNESGRELHGRTVQSTNQVYLLPSDMREMERLDLQHRVVFLAMEALCWPMEDVRRALADRGSTIRILDIGTGSGRWAVDMAKEFPHAEVLGIDLSPGNPKDTPGNCRFETMDVMNHDISHMQRMYDLVHCRTVMGGMRHYQSFIKRATELVKPGGLFLDIEADHMVYDEKKRPFKPAYVGDDPRSASWWGRMLFELRNRVQLIEDLPPAGWGPSLPKWLSESPRLKNVKHRPLYVPIGWPGCDDVDLANGEEVGRLMRMNMLDAVDALRPALLAGGMEVGELDKCIQETMTELVQVRVKSYLVWHYCAAQVMLD